MTQGVEVGATIDYPITIDGDVHDAQVYPQERVGFDGRGAVYVYGLMDEGLAVSQYQNGIAGFGWQVYPKPGGYWEAEAVEVGAPAPVTMLVERQAARVENRQLGAPLLVGVSSRYFPNDCQGQGGGQAEGLAHLVVATIDKRDTAKDTLGEGDLGDVVTGGVGLVYNGDEGLDIASNLHLGGEFHGPLIIAQWRQVDNHRYLKPIGWV